MDFTIRNARVCTPEGVRDAADVAVEDGRITQVGPPSEESRGDVIDAHGMYLVPGFIDPHAHGARLFEFTAGRFRPESGDFDGADESWRSGLPQYAAFLARTGVTNVCVATWAAPVEQLARAYGFLRDYMHGPGNGRDGARFLGGNLEGTFLNPDMAGAQNPDLVLAPDPATFDAINRAGAIRMANVVPDHGEPAYRLIDHLTENCVVPGFGHTNATALQVREGVRRGLRYCVHFTNGPTGGSYKPFNRGGAIEAVLQTPGLYAELILDTYHVNPAYVRDIIRRKGGHRVMVVTDQMFATDADEVTAFTISGIRGILSADRRYVQVEGKPNTLFSSVLTMDAGFSNLLSLLTREMAGVWNARHEAMPLAQAVAATARMCASNTADMLGIAGDTGRIAPGKRADLVLGRIEGEPGTYALRVERTYVAGERVA